jgi:ABC-type transport system involved in multi-copper enzyme maturation permease subunit
MMDVTLNMVGLRAMLSYSVRKLLTNRRWIIVLLLAALIGVVMGYSASLGAVGALDQGSDLLNLLVLSFVLPIMAMIFGASMIRNEIDDRSITQVITSPVDRRISYFGILPVTDNGPGALVTGGHGGRLDRVLFGVGDLR